MAKVGTSKKQKRKPSKKKQYERFIDTARELGVDNAESERKFERAFEKIVPPKRKSSLHSS